MRWPAIWPGCTDMRVGVVQIFTLLVPLLLMASQPLPLNAQTTKVYSEGVHYQVITPAQRTRDPSKIEVMEFFWYGCSHCYHFEPLVKQWAKTRAADVDFVPSPAIWNAAMGVHAQAYYTALALGVLEVMHDALFAAINVDGKRLTSEQELSQLFGAYGVDTTAFSRTFHSFGVNSQLRQADSRARGAGISGTPELMVAGKYRISAGMAGSQEEMLKVADFLVEKERRLRLSGQTL
ncbi:MAG: thiol:disulfide interchange protein DsbA/DsbL [Halieaceae bacterium]|nr:thiol:disulfide interchange protein DsbA/DsbL [Halieaceae bacterium]